MAHAMVVKYGMSDRLGPLNYDPERRGDEAPLFGDPYSDATAEAIDAEVQALVEEARSRARTVLREKRSLLDQMATRLLDEEVLDTDALTTLLGERSSGNSGQESADRDWVNRSREGKGGGQ